MTASFDLARANGAEIDEDTPIGGKAQFWQWADSMLDETQTKSGNSEIPKIRNFE